MIKITKPIKVKDKCMYCGKELSTWGYPICDECWKERLTRKDKEKYFGDRK